MGAKKTKRPPVLVSDLKKTSVAAAASAPAPKKKAAAKRPPAPDASSAYRFVSPTHGKRPRQSRRVSLVRVVKKVVGLARMVKDTAETFLRRK